MKIDPTKFASSDVFAKEVNYESYEINLKQQLISMFESDINTCKRLKQFMHIKSIEEMVLYVYKKRPTSRKIKEFMAEYNIFTSDEEKLEVLQYLEYTSNKLGIKEARLKKRMARLERLESLESFEKLETLEKLESDEIIDMIKNVDKVDDNGNKVEKVDDFNFNFYKKNSKKQVIKLKEPSKEVIDSWTEEYLKRKNYDEVPKFRGQIPLNKEAAENFLEIQEQRAEKNLW